MLKLQISKFLGVALCAAVMLILSAPAGSAQSARGMKNWTWGPPGCVRVWSNRSRQTRYGGAPRCRRVPV